VLKLTINSAENRYVFSGDTFSSKDRIKQLGRAKWNATHKTWEVESPQISLTELETLFPGLVVERSEGVEAEPSAPAAIASSLNEVGAESSPIVKSGEQNIPPSVTVGELSQTIRATLTELFPQVIYVRGVLNKVTHHRNGKLYIELADESSRDSYFNCVVWGDEPKLFAPLRAVGFVLERDLQVMFGVKVGLNPKDGRISLSIVAVVAEYTVGKLAAERELTNQRLKKEGLFDRNRSTAFPFLPRRLGILTSSQGTVIHDFLASLETAQFGFELFQYHISVQGREARGSIVAGLKKLSELPLDAILLFRGGGSPADLAIFSDYEVARAICLCPKPVISAIGHQEDQSSAQDVSFRAFGVPKDVGTFFAEIIRGLRERVTQSSERFLQSAARIVETRTADFWNRLQQIASGAKHVLQLRERDLRNFARLPMLGREMSEKRRMAMREVQQSLLLRSQGRWREAFDSLRVFPEILRMMKHLFTLGDSQLKSLELLVEGAKPETQLKRGFTLVRTAKDGQLIVEGEGLPQGVEIEIQFRDLSRQAKITDSAKK